MATCKNCEAIYTPSAHKKCPVCGQDNFVLQLNAHERAKLMDTPLKVEQVPEPKVESSVVTNGELEELFGYGG
jgi:hypothetical protein